ncbi:MAG: S8 family peptidase [Methylocella sp.]
MSGPRLVSGVPAKDEHRYVPDEVLFELRAGVSPQTADAIARRERLQRLASQPLELIGTTLYRYRIKDKRSVPTVVAVLERDARIGTVQPNYLYRLQQGAQNGRFAENQYAVPKMHLTEAHTISNGEKALVAVIDSGIDSTHPEISGAITESYDAINGGKGEKAARGTEVAGFVHGTEVAGIIASHVALTGVAPQTHILAVRAFKGGGKVAVVGETFDILAGIEWAVVKHNARIVNMSFGGPPDPLLSRELAGGAHRGVIVVAAVGNEGKAAKPLFPAADENVIAVTATDQADAIFKGASRCPTTCVAAPGVDIVAAAPNGTLDGTYRSDSGTSMAAAQVSGVIALLLDAKPDLESKTGRDLLVKAVRDILVKTAKHLSPGDPDESSIAGIVDAYATLEAAAGPGLTGENAVPIIERRSAGASDPPGPPTSKDVEPQQNAPPVDNSPTGSVKPDAQSESTILPIATDAELAGKEEILWQLKKDGFLSMDQFQRQLQDLEAAKTEFINKCPQAPHKPGVVNAEFQGTDRARAITVIRDYGLEAKFLDSVDLTSITVPVGQEWFWVDVLQASGLFTHVDREQYYCQKSVDTIVGISHPDIDLPKPTAKVTRAENLQGVVDFLKAKYPTAEVNIMGKRYQNALKVEINHLRGSVLSGRNYWERLEIRLVLEPGELVASVEGWYAPGIGASAPDDKAYESMEKEYHSDLWRFTTATLFANMQQQ